MHVMRGCMQIDNVDVHIAIHMELSPLDLGVESMGCTLPRVMGLRETSEARVRMWLLPLDNELAFWTNFSRCFQSSNTEAVGRLN